MYVELILSSVKSYIDTIINQIPPLLIIHKDSSLTPTEHVLRDLIEENIYPLTKYDPILNNKENPPSNGIVTNIPT